jgi:hypothetical protein
MCGSYPKNADGSIAGRFLFGQVPRRVRIQVAAAKVRYKMRLDPARMVSPPVYGFSHCPHARGTELTVMKIARKRLVLNIKGNVRRLEENEGHITAQQRAEWIRSIDVARRRLRELREAPPRAA